MAKEDRQDGRHIDALTCLQLKEARIKYDPVLPRKLWPDFAPLTLPLQVVFYISIE
jgi:hypothetical protein